MRRFETRSCSNSLLTWRGCEKTTFFLRTTRTQPQMSVYQVRSGRRFWIVIGAYRGGQAHIRKPSNLFPWTRLRSGVVQMQVYWPPRKPGGLVVGAGAGVPATMSMRELGHNLISILYITTFPSHFSSPFFSLPSLPQSIHHSLYHYQSSPIA